MKKFFTLSLVAATAVSAFAFQAKKNSNGTFAEARPAMTKVMSVADVKKLDMPAPLESTMLDAAAESPYKAFYSMHGILLNGIAFGEEGFGYSYNKPYAIAPVSGAYCQGVKGNKWTIGKDDTDITEECAGNKYEIEGEKLGGGYYMPKIRNGNDFYYYGSDGANASVGYGIVFTGEYATDEESLNSVGNYNIYANTQWYMGFSNTVAFGSRKFINKDSVLVTSNSTMIEYEVPAGQYFVLDRVEIPLIVSSDENGQDYASIWEDEEVTLDAYILEETGVKDEYNTYHATISTSDLDSVGDALRMTINFTEVDEDGFEAGITPVLRNNFRLIITGFAKPGIHIGIQMIYDVNSYQTANGYVSEYGTHSYFDQYRDGVVYEDGAFFYDSRVEALVNLIGSYYTFCDYSTGAAKFEGTVPFGSKVYSQEGLDFCVAVSGVSEEGKEYNDFDIFTDATADEIVVVCDDPNLLGYDVDDSYFESNGVQIIYFYVKPVLAGEQGYTVRGTIETEIASMDFEIVAMDENGTSLQKVAVAKENKTMIYNMMGQQVKNTNAKGIYMMNGKKVIK